MQDLAKIGAAKMALFQSDLPNPRSPVPRSFFEGYAHSQAVGINNRAYFIRQTSNIADLIPLTLRARHRTGPLNECGAINGLFPGRSTEELNCF